MAQFFHELLGDTLLKNDGTTVPTLSALDSKIVGLYFSAHWCPPCRGFTPELSKTYKNITSVGRPFEIVFVSSDKDENSFNEYFAEMPWLALPYSQRDRKAQLAKQFKVAGIPTLVILDTDGKVVTLNGREEVLNDPQGADFPWRPQSVYEVLGNKFLKNVSGETVGKEAIEGKFLGLYFSAHWCPPCRGFTPNLIETYKKLKTDKEFEIIFVSSDNDLDAFNEYFGTMPWLSLPYEDRSRNQKLNSLFQVEGIPKLVILDPKGEVITTNARRSVQLDPTGSEFPWYPKPVNDLSAGAGNLNEEVSLILFMEKSDPATISQLQSTLETFAKEHIAKVKAGQTDLTVLFFTASSESTISSRIREICKLGEPGQNPVLILLDIPDNGGFYLSEEKQLTLDNLRSFLKAYQEKALVRCQLSHS